MKGTPRDNNKTLNNKGMVKIQIDNDLGRDPAAHRDKLLSFSHWKLKNVMSKHIEESCKLVIFREPLDSRVHIATGFFLLI